MSCAKPRASPRPRLRQVMNAERSHRTSFRVVTSRSPRQGVPRSHAARRRNRTSPEARRTEVRFRSQPGDRKTEQTRRSAQSESRSELCTHDPPPEMHPADICNPHVKDEHPGSRSITAIARRGARGSRRRDPLRPDRTATRHACSAKRRGHRSELWRPCRRPVSDESHRSPTSQDHFPRRSVKNGGCHGPRRLPPSSSLARPSAQGALAGTEARGRRSPAPVSRLWLGPRPPPRPRPRWLL
jgi:hypothetical protein